MLVVSVRVVVGRGRAVDGRGVCVCGRELLPDGLRVLVALDDEQELLLELLREGHPVISGKLPGLPRELAAGGQTSQHYPAHHHHEHAAHVLQAEFSGRGGVLLLLRHAPPA